MAQAVEMTLEALNGMERSLTGKVLRPGQEAYDETCTLFNSMIDKRPVVIAQCANPQDVATALLFGREHSLEIAVRAGGHSVAGMSLCDGGLVIDVRPMNKVEVDPQRRIARVGGGCTWSQFDRATQEHGLATTGGRVWSTGALASRSAVGPAGWSVSTASPATTSSRWSWSPRTVRWSPSATTSVRSCSGRCTAVAAISGS